MKINLVMVLAVLASSAAMAEDTEAKDPAGFQISKEKHLAHLQERLQMVQTNISCVQAAQDSASMKVCKAAAKQAHEELEKKVKAAVAEKKAKKDK